MRRLICLGLAASLIACDEPDDPSPPSAGSTTLPARSAGPAPLPIPKPALAFSQDDFEGAVERAGAEKKAVLVDVWAPWCHTCLSMKHYVFTDASLRPLGKRVVPVALDSDKEVNAPFLARYDVTVWPTFFVIDANDGGLVGSWQGAASVREFRDFVERSLAVIDSRRSGSLPEGSALALLVDARALHAKADYRSAADAYGKAIAAAPPDWNRRSEALLGRINALHHAEDWVECARVGRDGVAAIKGAAIPADFIRYYWGCMTRLRKGPERAAAQRDALARLRTITDSPSPEMSADDVADALSILADAHESLGDEVATRRAHERRLAVLEEAAERAPTPAREQTYDHARANAYVALKRPHMAIEMLREREKQLPHSYEPPARLAVVLMGMHAWKEALAAIDRAIAKSYGPRRIRYLRTKQEIQNVSGDRAGSRATLERLVKAHEELPPGQRDPDALADVKKRLESKRRNPH